MDETTLYSTISVGLGVLLLAMRSLSSKTHRTLGLMRRERNFDSAIRHRTAARRALMLNRPLPQQNDAAQPQPGPSTRPDATPVQPGVATPPGQNPAPSSQQQPGVETQPDTAPSAPVEPVVDQLDQLEVQDQPGPLEAEVTNASSYFVQHPYYVDGHPLGMVPRV